MKFQLNMPDEVPDSWLGGQPGGREWAVKYLDPAGTPEGMDPEVALLEASGTVYLNRTEARQLAGLLLAYAAKDEAPGANPEGHGSEEKRDE